MRPGLNLKQRVECTVVNVKVRWHRWRKKNFFPALAVLAAVLTAALPLPAYVGCVASHTECSFAITCYQYDDNNHENLGEIFHIEFYSC